MRFRSILRLLTIPETSPSLALAHLSALKQQVPLLYLIITINAATLSYTHFGIAPTTLVVLPVCALSAICIVRAVTWIRLDLNAVSETRRVPLLRRTNRLTALISPALLLWSLSLAYYGDDVTNLHVFFFLALTPIGCIFCLTHLRSAALIIACTVLAPAIAFVFYRHGAVLTSIAINLLIVGGVMVFILFIQYRGFVKLAIQNEELKSLNEQTSVLASTDALTGLANRRSFFPKLDDAIAQSSSEDTSFVYGLLDLDGFKNINDSLGHAAGDRVLIETAKRLLEALPSGSALARLGGDEFALIIYEHERAASDVDGITRLTLAALQRPFAGLGSNVRISASIGYVRYSRETSLNASEIIERADFALYEAKARHRGGWVLFADQHEGEMRQQNAIEGALRHADLTSELTLVYQPMIDVVRQKTVAFEALARWSHPELGNVPPDRFIAAAERIGLINEITLVLFRKALDVAASWPLDVALSFNLSMADITSYGAISQISDLITESGIEPSRLQFEATETAMLGDFNLARTNLERLKATGAKISLDDFGTGYSSLSHIHRLPVDKLKIDQSFTREMATNKSAFDIVASIIGLCKSLKLECVVEGVETATQAIQLQSIGCRVMQGYLFSKPLPAHDVGRYLMRETIENSETSQISTSPALSLVAV